MDVGAAGVLASGVSMAIVEVERAVVANGKRVCVTAGPSATPGVHAVTRRPMAARIIRFVVRMASDYTNVVSVVHSTPLC